MKEGKAFHISQKEVLNAYKAVKANKGAGGIDGIELEEFDKDWKNRLYVLWNRMSSGSYYSKPVRGVEIPKKNGKKRLLGIPTIEDRVAQMVLGTGWSRWWSLYSLMIPTAIDQISRH